MNLSLAVQHHPARAELLPRLISRLTPLAPQVVRDPDPTGPRQPWRTYRLALETTPVWATHRVIVQDDVVPCEGFPRLLRAAVAARPDRLIVLCLCGRPAHLALRAKRALDAGDAWVSFERYQWVPVVGLVWPARFVQPALQWISGQKWPREFYADDEIVGRVAKGLREPVLATVPSLIQHPDTNQSLIGQRARGGADVGRVAAVFFDDPGEIDWSRGPV